MSCPVLSCIWYSHPFCVILSQMVFFHKSFNTRLIPVFELIVFFLNTSVVKINVLIFIRFHVWYHSFSLQIWKKIRVGRSEIKKNFLTSDTFRGYVNVYKFISGTYEASTPDEPHCRHRQNNITREERG